VLRSRHVDDRQLLGAGQPGRFLAAAITIAAPRALIPAQATALAAGARLRAAQATATRNTDASRRAVTTPILRSGWQSAATCPGTNSTP
jgi:hypothetical protein